MANTRLAAARERAARRTATVRIALAVVGVALVVGMVLNTRVISLSDPGDLGAQQFSAADYAEENFETVVQPTIAENAVPAEELLPAIAADVDAAGEQYGGRDGQSAWAFPVSFTGTAGEIDSVTGQMPVTVDGVSSEVDVIVQMGPAINGSALRDATGEISFGSFTNQLEFQSVAVELNNKVKELVLADVDRDSLEGATVSVVGAFSYANPQAWIVTPISFEVAG